MKKEVIVVRVEPERFPGKWSLLGALVSVLLCMTCIVNYTFQVWAFPYYDVVSVLGAIVFILLAILCTMIYHNQTNEDYAKRRR